MSTNVKTNLDIIQFTCARVTGPAVKLSSDVLTHLSREIQGVPLARIDTQQELVATFELMPSLEYSISPCKNLASWPLQP